MTLRRARPDDLDAVAALVVHTDTYDLGLPTGFELDVREDWGEPGFEQLVADDPELGLAAFGQGWHRLRGQIWCWGWVHPERRGRGLGAELVEALERCGREHGDRLVLHHTLPDPGHEALFGARGYEVVRSYWRMAIDLAGPPPAPEVPAGLVVRPFRPGEDDEAVYEAADEAFADHWGHERRPYAEFERRIAGAEPGLWLVALDGDEVAGCLLCSLHDVGAGFVDTLAVRRPWRNRGLGRALLLASFGLFHERGRPRIELTVDADNTTGATDLYERAGMHVVFRWDRRDKALV